MKTLDGRARRVGTRVLALAVTLASATGAMTMAAESAHAQKVNHTDRLYTNEAPIANYATYNANGTPATRVPGCTVHAGVFRGGKVWADTYGVDERWHTQFRMNFWTTYSASIANAKFAYESARTPISCDNLNVLYKNQGTKAGVAATCNLPTKTAMARWCSVYKSNPGDVALDVPLIEKCANHPNGPFAARINEWHNLSNKGTIAEAQLYKVDVLSELGKDLSKIAAKFGLGFSIPVYVDDITSLSGVRNFNPSTGQPSWGSSWQGYGHVQTPGISEAYINWFDGAARAIGKNPITSPVAAHKAVQTLVDKGQSPTVNGVKHKDLIAVACAWTPTIQSYLDPDMGVSNKALGQTLSEWVQRETGKSLCDNIRVNPEFKEAAPFACRNEVIGAIFSLVDNGTCMNRPDNQIAVFVKADLGCNRDTHVRRLFTQIKKFLGG